METPPALTSPPGTVEDLGKKVKAKYPGTYDNLSDAEVGRRVKHKHPEAYGSFTDVGVSQRPPEHALPKPPAQQAMTAPPDGGVPAGPLPTQPGWRPPASWQPFDPSVQDSSRGTGDIFKDADRRIKDRGMYQDPPLVPEKKPDIQYDKPLIFSNYDGAAVIRPDGTRMDPREARIEEDWQQRVREFTPGQYTDGREAAMKEAGTWTAGDEFRKGREKREFQANILRRRQERIQNQITALRDQGWAMKEQQLADEELRLRTAQEQGQPIDPAQVQKFQRDLQAYQQVMKPLLDEQKDIQDGFNYLVQRDQEDHRAFESSPEVRDQKARQAIVNERYQQIEKGLERGDLHWYSPSVLEAKVVQPTTSTATKFLFDAAGALGRTLDTYGNIPNRLAGQEDYYSPFAIAADNLTSAVQEITTTPDDWKKPIIEKDWSINTNSLIPKLVQSATYMTLLGASGARGGNTGLTAAAYASTEEDYYREAIDAGLTPGQAQAFSMPAAAAQALLERVSPGPLMGGKSVKDVMMERTLRALKGGASPEGAIKDAFQYALTETSKEGLQEGMQGLADVASRNIANLALGDEKLDGSLNPQSLAEQTLLGAAMGFLAATPGATKRLLQRPMTAQTMDWAARNSQKVKEFIEQNGGENKADLLKKLQEVERLYDGNRLKEMPPEKATQVAPKIAEVQDIDAQIKQSPMDPVIEAAVGDPRMDRKEELTREILSDMGLSKEEQEEALVKAKIIPPPVDAEGKPIKPKETSPRRAKAVIQSDETDQLSQTSVPESLTNTPQENATQGGTPIAQERAPDVVETVAAPTPEGEGGGPVSPEAAQIQDNEGQPTQQTAETPPPQASVPSGVLDQPPAPEQVAATSARATPERVAKQKPEPVQEPVAQITEVDRDQPGRKAKEVSYKIPSWENYNTKAVKTKGGWSVFVVKDGYVTRITPIGKEQPTSRLAASDAAERMNRHGKEKVDALIEANRPEIEHAAGGRSVQRIPVSPITGDVRDRSKVLRDLSKGIGRRVGYEKTTGRATGTYSPSSAAIKIRYSGDLDTTSHEVGHALDDKYGLGAAITNDMGAYAELMDLSKTGSNPPKGYPDPQQYRIAEGIAEYLRARIVNPQEATAKYPEVSHIYEDKVPKDVKGTIDSFSNDVRAFAGATGAEMVMSNVQFEPSKSNSILRDLFKDNEGFSMTFADRLKAQWVDPLSAFQKAIEYAQDLKGVEQLKPSKDPYLLARLLLHINGKTSEVLSGGMFDSKNRIISDASGKPKSLNWLLEPLDNTSPHTVEQEARDVTAYMIAERTVELAKRFGRQDVLTGIGGGIFSDVDVAKKTIDDLSKDPLKLARLQEAASRYREVATHVLEYLRDKGRLSDEQFDQIKENNLQYVALQRVMEATPGETIETFKGPAGKLGSKGQPIKSIYGSSRKILNPYVSLMDSIHKSIKEGDRNEVMVAFTDLLKSDRKMYEGEPVPLSDVGTIGKPGDKNSITVFRNGKPETWVFQKDVYEALKGLDNEGYKLPGIVRAPASILRWTVTHFPVFAMKNIARDVQSRMILSSSYSARDTAKLRPLRDLFGNKEHWAEVARAGGLNAGYYMKDDIHYYGMMREAMHEIAKNKKMVIADPVRLRHVWRAYEDALYKSETVNRVAEYRAAFRKARAEGMDDYNAQLYGAFRSSDLIDFAVAGHYARVVNQVVPFTNAMIQGLRSAWVSGKRDPVGLTARLGLYAVLPSALVWTLAHQDDDTAEEYEQLPAYQRDMFYNIKLANDKWLVIPKPFELGLPGAATERLLSSANGNKRAWDGYAGSVAKSVLPDESAIAGPGKIGVELIANYDFFRDKPIVPPEDDKLMDDLHDSKGASRAGQILQDRFGMDARKWDHLIESQFSYFGKTALKISDIGDEDSRHQFGLDDLGFFKGSPAYNSSIAVALTKAANEYGLTGTRDYKSFRKAADKYFAAKTADQRDALAKELRETAEKLLPKIEEAGQKKLKEAREGK